MRKEVGETRMRYEVKGEVFLKAGSESFSVGATVEASGQKEAKKKAIRQFGLLWASSGYALKIGLIHLKN